MDDLRLARALLRFGEEFLRHRDRLVCVPSWRRLLGPEALRVTVERPGTTGRTSAFQSLGGLICRLPVWWDWRSAMHRLTLRPGRRARMAVAGLAIAAALALGGCVVGHRDVTDLTPTTATLTAVARCDGGRPVACRYRMRWRAVGTRAWTLGPLHGPVRVRTGRVTLRERITGLSPGTRYRWQLGVKGDRLRVVAWFPGRSFTTPPAGATAPAGAGTPADRTPPTTRLSAMPANVTQSATATFAFTANEASTFTCGLDLRPAAPCRSPQTYGGLSPGRHVFRVWARDGAGNVERTPRVWSWAVFPPSAPRPLRVAAVGDIHPPSRSANSAATGVEAAKSDIILTIGDHQYQSGTPAEFRAGWDTDRWALNLPKMYPVLAPTHDDDWRNAYPLQYFNARGPAPVVQLQPRRLALHGHRRRVLPRHRPLQHRGAGGLGPGQPGGAPRRLHDRLLAPALFGQADPDPWPRAVDADDGVSTQILYFAGVEVVLNGHQHGYERFAPQRPDGVRDDARGIRSFIVGTGGIGFYPVDRDGAQQRHEADRDLRRARPHPPRRKLRVALPADVRRDLHRQRHGDLPLAGRVGA